MATAPRVDQLQLIEVAERDAEIARLRRSDLKHPLRAEVASLKSRVNAVDQEISATAQSLEQINNDIKQMAQQSSQASKVIHEKKMRLKAGTGMDSRMLLALQAEIDAQQRLIEELDGAEYEAWERQEELEATVARLEAEREQLQDNLLGTRTELENALTAIGADIANVKEKRAALYDPLAPALKQEYERALARGGLAVIGVHPNGTSTGGVQLSPIEVSQLKNAAPDTIWLSEDYDCIVVLLDN